MEVALAPVFQQLAEIALLHAGVFVRIAATLALLPGIGDRAIPVRIKLVAALGVTLLLAPMVASVVPDPPRTPLVLVGIVASEAAAGLVIGLAFRFMIMALQIAGSVAAVSMSVSHVFAGPLDDAEPTIAILLAMGGVVLAMMAGLHVAAVAALATLYDIMPFGRPLAGAMVGEWGVLRVAEVFALGLSLALPFVAIGFLYNLALGALSRAMPQLLVALVGAPLLVGLGLGVLWLGLPEIFGQWLAVLAGVFDDPLGSIG